MPDWLKTIYTSPAKTFKAFWFVFIVAVAFASFPVSLGLSQKTLALLFGAVFLCLTTAVLCMNKKSVRFGFLMMAAICLGVWRFGVGEVAASCVRSGLFCNLGKESVEFIGTIVEAPSERLDNTQYVVRPNTQEGETSVLVAAQKYPKFNYGNMVRVGCKLQLPENEPGSTFNYIKYLQSKGIGATCNFPKKFELEAAGKKNVYNYILVAKEKLATEVGELWAEPAASLMAGILYGERSTLPPDIKNEFSVSGLSHVIAVSGFNVSVIAAMILLVLTRLGVKRSVAAWVAFGLIWVFVIFVGASAAAVRAGIMASVVLIAERLGRLSNVGGTLVFAVSLMALHNPYILLWDIGFQLSFIATLGLVYGTPIIESKIKDQISKKVPDFIIETGATTLAAIIATLPIILYYFGKFSPTSLIANILVVPLIPWLMLIGVIALFLGFMFTPLGMIVAFVANVGLQYVLSVVHVFGKPSLALNLSIPWWGMVVLYSVLIMYAKRTHARLVL